jgi:hypothetical protein
MKKKGRDIHGQGGGKEDPAANGGFKQANQRKLIILPAKPPPRKTQSVLRNSGDMDDPFEVKPKTQMHTIR